MKERLVQILSGSKGRLTTVVTAAVVGVLVNLFAKYNLPWGPDFENAVSAAAGLAVGWAIDNAILRINTAGIKQIQEALPAEVKVDGYAGAQTVEAVQEATGNVPNVL